MADPDPVIIELPPEFDSLHTGEDPPHLTALIEDGMTPTDFEAQQIRTHAEWADNALRQAIDNLARHVHRLNDGRFPEIGNDVGQYVLTAATRLGQLQAAVEHVQHRHYLARRAGIPLDALAEIQEQLQADAAEHRSADDDWATRLVESSRTGRPPRDYSAEDRRLIAQADDERHERE